MDIAVNYLAVVAAAVASMAIGAAWYSPLLFGKEWMRLSGMSPEFIEGVKAKGTWKMYGVGFIGALVMAFVLAHLVFLMEATTLNDALDLGFWLWLGFIAPVQLGVVLWEGKSWKLYLINTSYYLVSLPAMASILALWV